VDVAYWEDLVAMKPLTTEEATKVKNGKVTSEIVQRSCLFERYSIVYEHAVDWEPLYTIQELTVEEMLEDMYSSFCNMDFSTSALYKGTLGTTTEGGMSEDKRNHLNKTLLNLKTKVNCSFYFSFLKPCNFCISCLMFLFLYSCLMHQVRVRYKRRRYFS
jgi:hypothetical protein